MKPRVKDHFSVLKIIVFDTKQDSLNSFFRFKKLQAEIVHFIHLKIVLPSFNEVIELYWILYRLLQKKLEIYWPPFYG